MVAFEKIRHSPTTITGVGVPAEDPIREVKARTKAVEADRLEDAPVELEPGDDTRKEAAKTKLKGLHLTIKRGLTEEDAGQTAKKAALLALAAGTTGAGIVGAQSSVLAAEVGRMDLRSAQANQIDHAQSSTAMYVSNAADIVRNFTPDRHVYVVGHDLQMGSTTIPATQLDELERWMDVHAPNAYVTIFQNGDSSGGWDQVKRTVGDGLSASPGFSDIKDSRNGQRDSLVLAISLDDKKHTIKAGEALDRRGLGEENYKGNLDQPFKDAMKGGDGLIVAIQNTISNINEKYDAQVKAEVTARENQINQAKQSVAGAGGSISFLEQKAQSFKNAHPGLTGDLTRPDVGRMRADLSAAERALESGDYAEATKLAQAVSSRAEAHVKALDGYDNAVKSFDALQQKIDSTAAHPYAEAGDKSLAEANRRLELARSEHRLGNASFATHYDAAKEAQEQALSAAQSKQAAHLAMQGMMIGVGTLALVGVAGLGYVKNKKARAKAGEAKQLLETWEKALNEKTTVLIKLLGEAQLAVGRGDEAMVKRLEGRTLAAARGLIEDIDNCLLQLGVAQSVLTQAEGKISPPFFGKVKNLFSTGNFEEAIEMLKSKPLVWDPDEGSSAAALVQLIKGMRSEREMLTGGLEGLQPFKWSFDQLMNSDEKGKEGFNVRSGRAFDALQVLLQSRQSMSEISREMRDQIETATKLAAEVSKAGEADKLFTAPSLGTMIAEAVASEAQARAQGQKDPIGAADGPAKAASRIAREASMLATALGEIRGQVLPVIDRAMGELAKQGIDSAWLDSAKRALSARAEEIAADGGGASIAGAVETLSREAEVLAARAEKAIEVLELRARIAKDLDEATELVETAREELGAAAKRRPEEMLREKDADPSDVLKAALEQHRASKAGLDRGDVGAAAHALEAARARIRGAATIVSDSRKAMETFAPMLKAHLVKVGEVEGSVRAAEEQLAAIRKSYAPSVMKLGAGDALHPHANGTIADNVEEANDALAKAREAAAAARTAFAAGKFLEAGAHLRALLGSAELGEHRLQEIADKQARLVETQRENLKLATALTGRSKELDQLEADPRAMRGTLEAIGAARKALVAAKALVEAAKNDPFEAKAALERAAAALDRAVASGANDRDIHAEADRSLKAAASQLESAKRLVVESANDGVTDSADIQRANQEIAALERALGKAQPELRAAHGDWVALDKEADRITAALATQAATLRRELDQAREAVALISRSASAVREASTWSGSYGVSISGSPGSSELDAARRYLEQGDYGNAEVYAQRAKREAESAVSDAESEVRSRRRAEEQRIAAERRRREEEEDERRRRASYSSDSSSSWSSSSSGGFGSSSSFTSSSSGGFGGDSSW